jgi:hypothetical protein
MICLPSSTLSQHISFFRIPPLLSWKPLARLHQPTWQTSPLLNAMLFEPAGGCKVVRGRKAEGEWELVQLRDGEKTRGVGGAHPWGVGHPPREAGPKNNPQRRRTGCARFNIQCVHPLPNIRCTCIAAYNFDLIVLGSRLWGLSFGFGVWIKSESHRFRVQGVGFRGWAESGSHRA